MGWHQDFCFDPHSNDDVLTLVVFLDDQQLDNGPLKVAPSSHRGLLHPLRHRGVFTGEMSTEAAAAQDAVATCCLGSAGDCVLMHARTAHSSAANTSSRPRRLFIAAIAAADAVPLAPNAVPSEHYGQLLC